MENNYYRYQPIPTSSQNNQHHLYEFHSQARILPGIEQNLNNNNNQQMKEQPKKKKKKCRGNRKAQHLRRRIRRREQKIDQNNHHNNIDHHIQQNTTIINNEQHILNEKQEQEQIQTTSSLNDEHNTKMINKRKRENSHRTDLHISQSFSQLSISQEQQQRNTKKRKSSNGINDHHANQTKTKKKDDFDESFSMNYMQKFKPSYLRVSNVKFKQMLSTAIPDSDQIIQGLDTDEKLQFVRQMTEVTNNLYYFDLQRQLWQEYYNVSLKEDTLKATTGRQQRRQFSKTDAKQHNTCQKYNIPRQAIEKRQQRIAHQMQGSINQLNEYLMKLNTWTIQCQPPIDPNILSNAINECVIKGQERLRLEFDYKKKMLEFNANDHYLINQFYELQPTVEQLDLAKMIWQTIADELKTKKEVEILRKRIFLQRLPATIDKTIDQSLDHVQSMLSNPVLDKDRCANLKSTYSKTTTQYKFDLMALDFNTLQHTQRAYQQTLMDLHNKLSQSNWNQSLKQAIVNRQETMRKHFFRRSSGDGSSSNKQLKKHFHHRRSNNIFIYTTITASLPFIEVDLDLTPEQIRMLINGLKYVIPCQSRFSRKPIHDTIKEYYKTISKTIQDCLKDNRILITDQRANQAFQVLEQIFYECHSKKLTNKLNMRAKQEYKIVQHIKRLLRQRSDIVIRRTDKSKVFYIGRATDFERKAQEYMFKTEAYEEITNGRCPLSNNLHAVQTLLDYLLMKNVLTKKQHKQLCPKLNQLELGHYHGIPKPHKPDTPLRPIVASIHAPTTLASKFLNDLLAPIYLAVNRQHTFINDIDLIRQLEKYTINGYLTSTTKFITIDVENLYTMIPREGALAALARFCIKYSQQGKIGTFTTDHIMKMARLILDNNCFAYHHKYYKQVRGGAMGSAFTQVLANIYMLEWEEDLIRYQTVHHEIYGRYIDDIFMTTNQTNDEINIILDKAKNKDMNIRIDPKIGTSVHFLDVTITNENGQLRTSIYHKPTAEPYILPYTSDHPRHIHRNIPYAQLLRIARICSNVNDFNFECIRLDMSLLLNSYPPYYITKQFQRFFHRNNAMLVCNELNEQVYARLHHTLLYQPTRREKQLQTMLRDPVRAPAVLQVKIWNKQIMFPRYLYDSALTLDFRKKFIQWWKKYYAFAGSPVEQVQVRLVANTNRTLEHFFIRKKPPRQILTKMET